MRLRAQPQIRGARVERPTARIPRAPGGEAGAQGVLDTYSGRCRRSQSARRGGDRGLDCPSSVASADAAAAWRIAPPARATQEAATCLQSSQVSQRIVSKIQHRRDAAGAK
jgi:hypothetical protein